MTTSIVEVVYLASGLVLPIFYLPQIVKLYGDSTRLASYSLSKAFAQFLLRLPTLVFALMVVDNTFMSIVLIADLMGRAVELGMAIWSLSMQQMTWREIGGRLCSWFRWQNTKASPDGALGGFAVTGDLK